MLTEEQKKLDKEILRFDHNEQLLARFEWYIEHIKEENCQDHYQLVKEEILRRMKGA